MLSPAPFLCEENPPGGRLPFFFPSSRRHLQEIYQKGKTGVRWLRRESNALKGNVRQLWNITFFVLKSLCYPKILSDRFTSTNSNYQFYLAGFVRQQQQAVGFSWNLKCVRTTAKCLRYIFVFLWAIYFWFRHAESESKIRPYCFCLRKKWWYMACLVQMII